MKIGVIGLGFVGLSLSSVLSSKGYSVIGIDTDQEKCEKISNGKPPFFEPGLEKTLKKGLKKKLVISNEFSLINDCDMIFVTVGTPATDEGEINLKNLFSVIAKLAKILEKKKKHHTIVIKSTVIPTTTSTLVSKYFKKIIKSTTCNFNNKWNFSYLFSFKG